MRESWADYRKRLRKHGAQLLGGAVFSLIGIALSIRPVVLPAWFWFLLALGSVSWLGFVVFHDLHQEHLVSTARIAELEAPAEFPDLDMRMANFQWGDQGNKNTLIRLPFTLTNREAEAISLQFRLGVPRKGKPILWLERLTAPTPLEVIYRIVHPPVRISGRTTETVEIDFWLANEIVEEIGFATEIEGVKKQILHMDLFVLEIEDYVSGTRREGPLPDFFTNPSLDPRLEIKVLPGQAQ